jgi:hypothetical protein
MTTATIGDTSQATAIAQHWIDGSWRDSAEHKDSINPATGEVIARYALAGEDEAREAVAAALTSFRQTDWKSDRTLRSRVLHEMADRLEARTPDLIQLLSNETGKIDLRSRGLWCWPHLVPCRPSTWWLRTLVDRRYRLCRGRACRVQLRRCGAVWRIQGGRALSVTSPLVPLRSDIVASLLACLSGTSRLRQGTSRGCVWL